MHSCLLLSLLVLALVNAQPCNLQRTEVISTVLPLSFHNEYDGHIFVTTSQVGGSSVLRLQSSSSQLAGAEVVTVAGSAKTDVTIREKTGGPASACKTNSINFTLLFMILAFGAALHFSQPRSPATMLSLACFVVIFGLMVVAQTSTTCRLNGFVTVQVTPTTTEIIGSDSTLKSGSVALYVGKYLKSVDFTPSVANPSSCGDLNVPDVAEAGTEFLNSKTGTVLDSFNTFSTNSGEGGFFQYAETDQLPSSVQAKVEFWNFGNTITPVRITQDNNDVCNYLYLETTFQSGGSAPADNSTFCAEYELLPKATANCTSPSEPKTARRCLTTCTVTSYPTVTCTSSPAVNVSRCTTSFPSSSRGLTISLILQLVFILSIFYML